MIRTLLTVSEEDRNWLQHYSREEGKSIAEIIRRAIGLLRQVSRTTPKRGDYLAKSAGIWAHKSVDGLRYMQALRKEWDR
jgi:hypothetical protein